MKSILMSATVECGVPPESIDDIYPATPLQEGLMALSVKQPGAYVAQHVFRLQPNLDISRFKAAWEGAAAMNPILRTRIISRNGLGMSQVVLKNPVEWEINRTDGLDKYIQDSVLGVQFGSPLIRFCLVEDMNGAHFFHWTIHHALYDAWSLSIIFKTVERVYSGEPILPPVGFNSFIKYLSNTNKDVNANANFWETYLSGANPAFFPSVPSAAYLAITDQSWRQRIPLSRSKRSSNITTATLLRVAWAVIVSQYSNSDDVVFGAILTGRSAGVTGISDIVGPTITAVPVRLKISKEQKVMDFLQSTQKEATEMTRFEQMGLQNIRHLNADTKNACDFQNLLVIQSQGAESGSIFNSESAYAIKASLDTIFWWWSV
jgi:hypothetical protein